MGADEDVLLADADFEDTDSKATAQILVAAIRKLEDADIILTGRQAADGDVGVVGLGIAELLCRPAITFAKAISSTNGMVQVVRVLENVSRL